MDCFHQLVFDFRFEKELKKGGGGSELYQKETEEGLRDGTDERRYRR